MARFKKKSAFHYSHIIAEKIYVYIEHWWSNILCENKSERGLF